MASGGEDGVICIWDLLQSRVDASEAQEIKRARRSIPDELLFQHNGHRSVVIPIAANGDSDGFVQVVDFQWNPFDPWTLLSVSDNVELDSGGGSLQVWRVSDLIYRPEQQVLQELQQHAYAQLICICVHVTVV